MKFILKFILIIVILNPLYLTAQSDDGCCQKYLHPESSSSLWLNSNRKDVSINGKTFTSLVKSITYEKQNSHFGPLQFLEICLLTVSAYHAQAAPHEVVHMTTAYSFGTKTKKWGIGPIWQYVKYKKDDNERKRADVFFTSMSAPIFSRLTCNLPRWIHKPEGPGLWLKWTSAYWYMSYSTTWITLVGTWVSHINDDTEAGYDFNSASRAILKNKSNRTIFLSFLTAIMAFDAYLTKDQIIYNLRALTGRETKYLSENSTKLSLLVLPNQIILSYTF